VGINPVDFESARPWCAGFVVRDLSPAVSNWRASGGLHALLRDAGVAAITGIDTRAVTRRIRTTGAQRAIITRDVSNPAAAVSKARQHPSLEGRDLVREVTTDRSYTWEETIWAGPRPGDPKGSPFADAPPKRHRVVAYDFGIKRGILRRLRSLGCDVTVVPASTPAKDALSLKPDGIFLSNGPGDPAAVGYAVEAARQLCESKLPVFGICLGHQLLGQALGGKTYKLKFGHHGANHPVMDLGTSKVEITSQNHGFAVDVDSMEGRAVLSHVSLNDKTVEGMRHGTLPIFSVQYHPEASPGPNDASYLFDRFRALMEERRKS
jgi:carbamoyl-phosphate synthase small subunit